MNEIKKILVIGGAGYVGTNLVTELLKNNYHVTVYDLMIYGNKLPEGKSNLKTIKGDVRDQRKLEQSLKGQDAIIHLACISNDPSFELNPKLGQEINFDCFVDVLLLCFNLSDINGSFYEDLLFFRLIRKLFFQLRAGRLQC